MTMLDAMTIAFVASTLIGFYLGGALWLANLRIIRANAEVRRQRALTSDWIKRAANLAIEKARRDAHMSERNRKAAQVGVQKRRKLILEMAARLRGEEVAA